MGANDGWIKKNIFENQLHTRNAESILYHSAHP